MTLNQKSQNTLLAIAEAERTVVQTLNEAKVACNGTTCAAMLSMGVNGLLERGMTAEQILRLAGWFASLAQQATQSHSMTLFSGTSSNVTH